MEASTVEQETPGQTAIAEGADPLADLKLSPEEAAEEAAERARSGGADDEEVARQREEALVAAQQELDAEGGSEPGRKGQELRENAGEPVGAMPAGEPDSSHIPPDQVLLRGTAQGAPKFAGKQPGTTILKLTGTKFAVDGGFRKGERIRGTFEALVVSEGAKDRLDKETMTASESIQTHDAVILDLELED